MRAESLFTLCSYEKDPNNDIKVRLPIPVVVICTGGGFKIMHACTFSNLHSAFRSLNSVISLKVFLLFLQRPPTQWLGRSLQQA